MSDPINDGGPAFPWTDPDKIPGMPCQSAGMTLRDWFAGKAMEGLMAEPENTYKTVIPQGDREFSETCAADMAWGAYIIADAMIDARTRKGRW
jgi:hypothetical protein